MIEKDMKLSIAIGCLFLTTSFHVLADGKMYWSETVPPKIPYQRALILFKTGTETLVLQSRYEIPKTAEKASMGWIVPVPVVPQIASMRASDAQQMFWTLSMQSSSRVTHILPIILIIACLGFAGLSIGILLICILSYLVPFPISFRKHRGRLVRLSLYSLLGCLAMLPGTMSVRGSRGVDVIDVRRAGIYDIRVVRSADSRALIAWLKSNNYKFDEKDKSAFDSYISKGWCFVVANINPTKDQNERDLAAEGLAAPLILRFPYNTPVFPVVLTGTGGHETEILIYIASDARMSCDQRLSLRFAGEMNERSLALLCYGVEPDDFFKLEDLFTTNGLAYPFLCKFKDTLTPEQMKRGDIVFTRRNDDAPYREHQVKW
jgi:hypothetical protein